MIIMPVTVFVSGNNDGIQYQSAIETFGVEYSNYLTYTGDDSFSSMDLKKECVQWT